MVKWGSPDLLMRWLGIVRGPRYPCEQVGAVWHEQSFDCGWSLLSHGVSEITRSGLGNLKPICERELNKLGVHQRRGRWNVSKDGEVRCFIDPIFGHTVRLGGIGTA